MAQTSHAAAARAGPHRNMPRLSRRPGAVTASGKAGYSRHVCPRCGNIDWRYIAGRNDDRKGMYCRLGCGAHWMPDDPDWLAQRLPDD